MSRQLIAQTFRLDVHRIELPFIKRIDNFQEGGFAERVLLCCVYTAHIVLLQPRVIVFRRRLNLRTAGRAAKSRAGRTGRQRA